MNIFLDNLSIDLGNKNNPYFGPYKAEHSFNDIDPQYVFYCDFYFDYHNTKYQ